jgi:adenosylhomocysteine nucleosidase
MILTEQEELAVVIVFASRAEANIFLAAVSGKLLQSGPYEMFVFDLSNSDLRGLCLISGIGKIAAEVALRYTFIQCKPHYVINAGLAGSLLDDSLLGELVQVDTVMDFNVDDLYQEEESFTTQQGPWNDLMSLSLLSVDRPVMDKELRMKLSRRAHIVDMEGYEIAHVCATFGVPCLILKAISDYANANTKKSFREKLPALSQSLANILVEHLDRF